ncbi:MAG: hypothetical protein ACO3O0_09080 [Bacteroidia bacterium]
MIRLRHITILMFLMIGVSSAGGQTLLKLYESKQPLGGWEIDPLGNLYVWSGYDLTKVDSSGNISQTYSSRENGFLSGLDVTNPFSPMLVYHSSSTLLELDNSFSIKSKLNPVETGNVDQLLICRVPGQGFWMFNRITGRPELLDFQARKISEGTPISSVLSGNMEVIAMIASDDYLVLTVKGFGLLVFDRYGTFFKKITGAETQAGGFSGTDLFYRQGDLVVKFDFKKHVGVGFMRLEDAAAISDVKIANGRVFMLKGNVILRYVP